MKDIRTALTKIDELTIAKATFEEHFTKTAEKATFTFNGWDGKSYDGETRTAYIYTTNLPGFENAKFIKVGKGVHFLCEDYQVEEKATGEKHPSTWWAVDVARV
ncbi:MAG: hypothetical protein IJ002_08030 [Clostridia bacterium]|nr:hypothetical protein [Clostridia bacterium]